MENIPTICMKAAASELVMWESSHKRNRDIKSFLKEFLKN